MLLAHHQLLMSGSGVPPVLNTAQFWINATAPALLYQTESGSLVSADNQTVQVAQSDGGITRAIRSNGATRPEYRTAVINGRSVLQFQPADNSFDVRNTSPAGTTIGAVPPTTVFSAPAFTSVCAVRVVDARAASGTVWTNDAIFRDNGALIGLHASKSGSTVTYHSYNWDGSADQATVTCPQNTWAILSTRHDGGQIRIRINGGSWVSAASGNTPGLDVSGSVFVGSNSAATPFAWDLAHLAIWNTALSDTDVSSVESYMNAQLAIF